jgi:Xaa-Pro dipeptidase
MATSARAYKVGQATLSIPLSLYADNRARLIERLRASGGVFVLHTIRFLLKPAAIINTDLGANAVVLLQGGVATTRHDTDHDDLFRQESYFHWAFGVREPDCYGG